jgi:hypothetical protein
MVNEINPFPLSGYHGSELFCDRRTETQKLISNIKNGVNSTLLSIRRMGKTGLVYHTFNSLGKSKNIHCVYVDIYSTQNLKDFTNQLGSAVLKAFPEKQSIGKKFMLLLKNFRPVISFDPLTNLPEVSFDFARPKEYENSLNGIFTFLESQGKTIVVAIDEFQQVTTYPEKNTEAMLRTIIQPLKNVRFIFSGSSKHLLNDIFSNSRRPFFASTQTLTLNPITKDEYGSFIREKFSSHKRKIGADSIGFICEWTRLHTYYTQAVCNRIFASGIKDITLQHVQMECNDLLKEQESIFFQYRTLLTSAQWELLRAIAKEDKLYHPSSKKFVSKHNVGTPSNVQRALEALLNKELIYNEQDEEGWHYRVYDCFLARWLAYKQ